MAAGADATILCVGTHGYWEVESVDQPHMRLLGHQDELITRVKAAAKGPVIVVLNVGSPKEMPWLEKADAVLLVHFGGQEMASAVTDLLLGDATPAGRLPTSWPRTLNAAPAVVATQHLREHPSDDLPQGPMDVPYAERLQLGYRATGADLCFPFGFGLSYTEFSYGTLEVKQIAACEVDGGPRATCSITVKNVGECSGAEVVQLYVESKTGPRCLRGFRRTATLAPGSEVVVELSLGSKELGAFFDTQANTWVPPKAGDKVQLIVGGSSVDVRASAELVLT